MSKNIRVTVCLENDEGAQFSHQVGIVYRPPGCQDFINMLYGLSNRVLGVWRSQGVGVFLSSIEFEGEARPFDVKARHRDGREFSGTFSGVDEDVAEFHARWAIAREAGRSTKIDDLLNLSMYLDNIQVEEVVLSGRVSPIEALASIHRALESGEGIEDAREKVRTALEQAGYPVEDTAIPGPG